MSLKRQSQYPQVNHFIYGHLHSLNQDINEHMIEHA